MTVAQPTSFAQLYHQSTAPICDLVHSFNCKSKNVGESALFNALREQEYVHNEGRAWVIDITTVTFLTHCFAEFKFRSSMDDFDGKERNSVIGTSRQMTAFTIFRRSPSAPLYDNYRIGLQIRDFVCPDQDEKVFVRWLGVVVGGSTTGAESARFRVGPDRESIIIDVTEDREPVSRFLQTMKASTEFRVRVTDECGDSTDLNFDMTGFKEGLEELERKAR